MQKIVGITGVILAGGGSTRMGRNKALLPYQGGRLIEAIHHRMEELFYEVIVVTNTPDQYDFLPCRRLKDLMQGMGPLGGIHAGLFYSLHKRIFAIACDMPFMNVDLVRHMASVAEGSEVVIPEGKHGYEPLHAIYDRDASDAIAIALHKGGRRLISFFDHVRVRRICREEVAVCDPTFRCFYNINTPAEYISLREGSEYKDELRNSQLMPLMPARVALQNHRMDEMRGTVMT